MRTLYSFGISVPTSSRSKLLHRHAQCYHHSQRWNHKKNYRKLSAASANNLQKQIRRAQARLSSAERKQRTRRLILLGSYLEHVTGEDPGKRDRLIKGLDVFLERDRDRQLFDLPHKENEEWQPQLNPPQMPSIKL